MLSCLEINTEPLYMFPSLRNEKLGKKRESESSSVMSDSLWAHGLYSPWNIPDRNTPDLLPFSRRSSQPRDQTRVSCIVGRFFSNWAIRAGKIGQIHDISLSFLHHLDSQCVWVQDPSHIKDNGTTNFDCPWQPLWKEKEIKYCVD